MCRLSIVVPYDRNETAFESTLVSVLENRPEFCEVLVTHDGSYDDPFDLTDEVRFVVAPGEGALNLLRAGVSSALGRIVHILERGSCATEGWTEQAIHLFEHAEIGCVAPVIRDADSNEIIAAGWRDTRSCLKQPVGCGTENLARSEGRSIDGAFVSGAFWRRSILDAIVKLPTDPIASLSDYAWAFAAHRGGWKCRIADEANVLQTVGLANVETIDLKSTQVMQQIRSRVLGERTANFALQSLLHVAMNPFSGSRWRHSIGRLSCALGMTGAGLKLAESVIRVGQDIAAEKSNARILKMPTAVPSHAPRRRAA